MKGVEAYANDNYVPFPQSNPTRRCPAFGFAWRHCRSHSQLDQTAMKIEIER
jgi:hypothetical protein